MADAPTGNAPAQATPPAPASPAAAAPPAAQPAAPPVAAPAQPPAASPAAPASPPPTQPSPKAMPDKAPDAPSDPNKASAGANPPGAKDPTGAAAAPEKYDLKLPKDSPLSQSRVDQIAADARAKGLSNEQAQELVQKESDARSGYQAELASTWKQKQTEWVETAKTDPEIGGERFKENVELAHRVINRFGSEALKNELNATGYGNHPEMLRFVLKIGREMAEDQLVMPEGRETPQKYGRYEDLYDHPSSQQQK